MRWELATLWPLRHLRLRSFGTGCASGDAHLRLVYWAPGALPCEGTGAHRQRREAYPQSSVFIHSFGRPRPSSRGDGSPRKKGDLTASQRPFDVLQTPGTGVQTLIRFPAQIVYEWAERELEASSLRATGQPEAQRAGTPLGVSHCRREQWTTDFVLCGDGSSCHSWAGC